MNKNFKQYSQSFAGETKKTIVDEIVKRLQAGDEKAYGELYNLFSEQIYRFIFFRTGSSEQAEDLMQESFLRFIDTADVKRLTNVRAYLYRIARNLIHDLYRSRNQQHITLDSIEFTQSSREHEIIFSRAELEILLKSINTLKTEWQELIILKHVELLSFKEMSEILGKSPAALRIGLHRALKALHKQLGVSSQK